MKRTLCVLIDPRLRSLPAARGAADKIKVVTTIPDLADMTRQIGGDLVEVTSLATGVEDIHAVPMKPSFAVTLNRADVVVLARPRGRARLPARAARGVAQPEDPARRARLHRLLGLRHTARGADAHRPLARRSASRWAIRTSTSIRCSARTWRARSPTGSRATTRSTRRPSSRTSTAYLRQARRGDRALGEGGRAAQGQEARQLSSRPALLRGALRHGGRSGRSSCAPGVDPTPAHIDELEEQMRRDKVDLVVRELHYPAGSGRDGRTADRRQARRAAGDGRGRAGGQGLHQLHRLQRADHAEGRRREADGGAAHRAARRRASATTDGRSSSTSTFAIERGEFVALLGPNGAGKTTLLRGIARPHSAARGIARVRIRSRGEPARLRAAARSPRSDLSADRPRGRAHGHVRAAAAASARRPRASGASPPSASSRSACTPSPSSRSGRSPAARSSAC